MQIYSISNAFISLEVSSLGAEIQSLYARKTQEEFIWQADPKYWAKHAPVLFPFIGELKNGTYTYNSREYKMPKHGFARDSDFELIAHEQDCIIFRLVSSAVTKVMYPFNFELLVTYSLKDEKMFCKYEIINKWSERMYFNIGAHPAFRLPNSHSTPYSLIFDRDKELERYYIVNGLLANEHQQVSVPNGRLYLTTNMFDKDAWVMKDLQSRSIILEEDTLAKQLFEVEFDDFNNLVLWSPPNAPFICIEPCCGFNDLGDTNSKLEEKEGVLILDAKKSICKQWSFKILD